ncbi:MAG: GAF domain-containing protein [Myxococcota bacterium]
MSKPPIPAGDALRILALESLRILDTPDDPQFDCITAAVAQHFNVPVALVSLVDRDRQWFKSRFGSVPPETPRDHAFCAYTIVGSEPLVVPDATADPRFADNPIVTGEFGLRAYAGASITYDGWPLGSVCIIDHHPRHDLTSFGALEDGAREIEQVLAGWGRWSFTTRRPQGRPNDPSSLPIHIEGKGPERLVIVDQPLVGRPADYWSRHVLSRIDRCEVQRVELDLSRCDNIDKTGAAALALLHRTCRKQGISLQMIAATSAVMGRLRRWSLLRTLTGMP